VVTEGKRTSSKKKMIGEKHKVLRKVYKCWTLPCTMSPSGTGHPPLISQHKATGRPRQWRCESHAVHPPPQLQIKHLMSTWIRVCVKTFAGIRVESYLKLQDIRWFPRSTAWFWISWSVSRHCRHGLYIALAFGEVGKSHTRLNSTKDKVGETRNRCDGVCLQFNLLSLLQWHLLDSSDDSDQSFRDIAIVFLLAW